jgi:hypothetical protein
LSREREGPTRKLGSHGIVFFFEIAVSVNVGEAVVEIAVSVLEIRSKAVSELRVAGVHGSEFTGRTVAVRRRRNPQ